MQALIDCCCGLDVHKDRVFVCILNGQPDEEPEAIEENFGTTQAELQAMCQWLLEHDCLYVAMESTGVYWRPIYEVCEAFLIDFKCLMVVNAHPMHNLPGRKSDIESASKIKSILCQSAWAAVRVRNSPFHHWFWSYQGKLGKKKAIIAVARKILALCYKLLKSGEFYDPVLALKPIQSSS